MSNPHKQQEFIGAPCPWCDGTGLYAKAAYMVGRKHHGGCKDCDGSTEYVPCGQCGGSGRKP